MGEQYSKIEDALQALREGRVIIVVDDEDRENEGDFVAAAEKVTPEIVEFMITHGRGLLCMPILPEVASAARTCVRWSTTTRRRTRRRTPFRSTIVCAGRASAPRSGRGRSGRSSTRRPGPGDLVRPGHLFPAGGQGGGRAPPRRAHRGDRRPGPAGRLDARRRPLRDHSTASSMAGREKLHAIAREHGLPIVSIEALIKYRRLREKLVHRVAEAELPTRYGEGRIIGYRVQHEPGNEPIAIVMGDLHRSRPPWSGCTRRASPATCSTRSAATAATSFTWPWR